MADRPDLGEDRWLPDRMAALGFMLEGERRVADEFIRLLDQWFEAIRGSVFSGLGTQWATVDPLGVTGGAATFARLLREFIDRAISWVIREAYYRAVGEGYEFSNRPWVAQHLQDVNNRLVRVPDEVFNLMRRQLDDGINEGESIPELAARIDQELLNANAERWVNRAVVIARTETVSAYNGATQDAFEVMAEADLFDEGLEKVWLASMDARTRDSHFAADGQRVPLAGSFIVGGFPGRYPGDPLLPAKERIQCRCTVLYVEPDEETDMSMRGFRDEQDIAREIARRRERGIIRARDE